MKKLLLLFTAGLLSITTVNATQKQSVTSGNDLEITSRYRYTQPVMFVERGVEFLIFADGSFDFNTDLTPQQHNNFYYRRSNTKRSRVNRTYGAPGHTNYHNGPRGVLVTHDRYGRVRRIGNVFINYDRRGRIKRAGTVYMNYRRGLLKQVGGLHIQYNRHGDIVGTRGFVNYSNRDYNNGECSVGYHDSDIDWTNTNEDYYYYRKNGKLVKQKKRGRK